MMKQYRILPKNIFATKCGVGAYVCICMYICIRMCICIYMYVSVCVYVCTCVYMCMCVYVNLYIYIYIYSDSDFILDFGKLPFSLHLGKFSIHFGKIITKIHKIGKIKTTFELGMTPL